MTIKISPFKLFSPKAPKEFVTMSFLPRGIESKIMERKSVIENYARHSKTKIHITPFTQESDGLAYHVYMSDDIHVYASKKGSHSKRQDVIVENEDENFFVNLYNAIAKAVKMANQK